MSPATEIGAFSAPDDDVGGLAGSSMTTFDSPHAHDADDIWQRARYDEWAGRLGAARMHGYLRALDDQFHCLLLQIVSGASDEALHNPAHDVASTAGMLGFDEITRCCRAVLEPSGLTDSFARAKLGEALRHAIGRLDLHFSEETREVAA